ncbi:hypothetical protein AAJCM20276_13740 [Acetobacter aceti]|uniref:Uncharacterized protein n=1 Tax=Acetobacter aceti TaxID=435 RepID=A0A6S6PIG3_ACEAC|nr:hypothetical protein AAJCM20276_13740 [Acetobacter aceti]
MLKLLVSEERALVLVSVAVVEEAAVLAAALTEAADWDALTADERSEVEVDEVATVVVISGSFRL